MGQVDSGRPGELPSSGGRPQGGGKAPAAADPTRIPGRHRPRAGKLVDNLRQELDQSRFLIVVCSPNSAKPNAEGRHWVNEEVERFCELGRADHVIPVIVEGTAETSLCPKIREEGLLGLDVTCHSKGRIERLAFHNAFHRPVADEHGVIGIRVERSDGRAQWTFLAEPDAEVKTIYVRTGREFTYGEKRRRLKGVYSARSYDDPSKNSWDVDGFGYSGILREQIGGQTIRTTFLDGRRKRKPEMESPQVVGVQRSDVSRREHRGRSVRFSRRCRRLLPH